MTREEMEKIYQDARNTTAEEMRELADLMQYVRERTEELDGLVEDRYNKGQIVLGIQWVGAIHGIRVSEQRAA